MTAFINILSIKVFIVIGYLELGANTLLNIGATISGQKPPNTNDIFYTKTCSNIKAE